MDGTPAAFPIETAPVQRYFFWAQIGMIVLIGIWFMGIGLVVAFIHGFTWGPKLSQQQADALKYWLDGGTLRVDQGVFFLKRKAIPLDRVTDVVLVQGPLMRHCGIWGLQVQTAGTGHGIPEAILYGVKDHERVRDQLLAARDRAVAAGRPS